MIALGEVMSVVICSKLVVHLTKSYLAEHHQALGLVFGSAVVSAFADDISKVNAFAKHIACRWSFQRGYFESFRKNADIVRQSRSMPEHHIITKISSVSFNFLILLDLENAHKFDAILIVSAGVGILDIFLNPPPGFQRLKRSDVALQFEVFNIDVTHFRMICFLAHQLGIDLDLAQRSKHV
jgi:hypothetical protein